MFNRKQREIEQLKDDVLRALNRAENAEGTLAEYREDLADAEFMLSADSEECRRSDLFRAVELWLAHRRRHISMSTTTSAIGMPPLTAEQVADRRVKRIIERLGPKGSPGESGTWPLDGIDLIQSPFMDPNKIAFVNPDFMAKFDPITGEIIPNTITDLT